MSDPGPSGARPPGESNHPAPQGYVYIALLPDDRFYVGVSHQQPKSLLTEHRLGKHSRFTRIKGVRSIAWSEAHSSLAIARHREQQLKCWTHAKKLALINGDMERLKALSRSRRSR